jgi:hypothetical protein
MNGSTAALRRPASPVDDTASPTDVRARSAARGATLVDPDCR